MGKGVMSKREMMIDLWMGMGNGRIENMKNMWKCEWGKKWGTDGHDMPDGHDQRSTLGHSRSSPISAFVTILN